MTKPEFMSLDSDLAKKGAAAIERLAEAGRKMTQEDYRAQRKSYALGAAKTEKEREELSAWWDRRYGVTS